MDSKFLDSDEPQVLTLEQFKDLTSNTITEEEDNEEVQTSPITTPTTNQTDEILNGPKSPTVVDQSFLDSDEPEVINIEEIMTGVKAEYTSDETQDLDQEVIDDLGMTDGTLDPRIMSKYDQAVGAIDIDRILANAEEEAKPKLEEIKFATANQEAIEQRLSETSGENVQGFLPRRTTEAQMLESLGVTRLGIEMRNAEEDRDNIHELLNDANKTRAASVNALLNTDLSLDAIGWIVEGGEWTPFYGGYLAITDVPENIEIAKELWNQGEWGTAALVTGATALDVGAGALGAGAVIKKATNIVKNRRAAFTKIREATQVKLDAKKAEASKVVKDNRDFSNQMIKEFELSIDPTGKTKISTKDRKGNLVLDYDAARKVGVGVTEEVYDAQRKYMDQFIQAYKSNDQDAIRKLEQESGVSANQMLSIAEETADGFVSPLLRADSFDSMVAVALDLKKKYPDAFNNDKTVIDNLFELSVSKKFDADEMNDVLAKYGLNFDQYVLVVVGSGSEAGKTLSKLSQLKRSGSFKVDEVKTRELERNQSAIVQTWRRIENIRRGSMTSMFKTAVRNFQSGMIRAPMEALENVFDTTMLSMSNEFNKKSDRILISKALRASGKGVQTFVSPSQWAGSLAPLKRIYLTPVASKQLTDIMLNNDKFSDQFKALQNNVNEYRKASGAGKGGAVDTVLSGAESVVDVLQVPNRIQEYVIRRGVFTGEMERLLKRDWGINLLEEMENGNWADIMANASSMRPKGARSIDDIVDEATKRALDVTYAKAPDVPAFKTASDFLSRTGLTAVTTPFPRFLANSTELLGQYSAGAFNPAMKRILGYKKGPLDAKDRQNISRNISGLLLIHSMYQYRTSEGAPADFKQIEGYDRITGENTVIDITAQFPLRQVAWIAEAMKRLDPEVQSKIPVSGPLTALGLVEDGDGTFDDWFDPKEFVDTFLGGAGRTGGANIFIDEIAAMAAGGSEDIIGGDQNKARLGRLVGDYIRTYLLPTAQVVEIQRMVGTRPTEYTDYSSDYPETFSGNVRRSLDQAGITTLFNPSAESELPSREFVLSEDRKRTGLGLGLMAGITVLQKNSPDAEYLIDKGFSEFELGSREKGAIRRDENAAMREYIPDIVEAAKELEAEARASYTYESDSYKKQYTVEEHVNATVIAEIGKTVKEARTAIGKMKYINAPEHALEYRKFKRMAPAARKYALNRFVSENQRMPSLVDTDDLFDLIDFAEEKKPRSSTRKRR